MIGTPISDRSRPRRKGGSFPVEGSKYPVRSVKVDEFELGKPYFEPTRLVESSDRRMNLACASAATFGASLGKLRVLVVDVSLYCRSVVVAEFQLDALQDDTINRTILSKRLSLDGHEVMACTNGRECVQTIESDRAFDCVLMDIQCVDFKIFSRI